MSGWFWIVIIVVALYYFGKKKKTVVPPASPIHLSVASGERPYLSYSGDFWTVTRDIAENMPFHESEVLIMVRRINDRYCNMEYQLEMDHTAIPGRFTFGEGITVSSDRMRISFSTANATGYSNPQLVLKTLVQDMSSPFTTITDASVVPNGGNPLVICRVKVLRKAS